MGHIHTGFTCSDASVVGGHYFAQGQTDPWKTVAYKSTNVGTGFFKVMMSAAAMGATSASTAGRAFIIHNEAGGRIGCVLLGEKEAVKSGSDKTDKPTNPLCGVASAGAKAFYGLTVEKAKQMPQKELAGRCLALKSLDAGTLTVLTTSCSPELTKTISMAIRVCSGGSGGDDGKGKD